MFNPDRFPEKREALPMIIIIEVKKGLHYKARLAKEGENKSETIFEGKSQEEAIGKLLLGHKAEFNIDSLLIKKVGDGFIAYKPGTPATVRALGGRNEEEALGNYALKFFDTIEGRKYNVRQ